MSEDNPKPRRRHAKGRSHGPAGHHEEGESGAPEWLISFADNTALLMGFFVILLAMNMAVTKAGGSSEESDVAEAAGQTAAALDWAIAVREGFHNPVDIHSTDPADQLLVARLRERRQAETQAQDDAVAGPHDSSQSLRPSDYYGPAATIEFALNSTALSRDAKKTLHAAAAELQGLRLITEVRGYASPAEAYDDPDRGMRLSFARAMAAANELVEAGLTWQQLRLVACGDAVHLREYNLQKQARHQRVDIINTGDLLPAD